MMFKTLIKSLSSGTRREWGVMATITGRIEDGVHSSGRIPLYPGLVEVLYRAEYDGIVVNLVAWVYLKERSKRGFPGYFPKPLGLPSELIDDDPRAIILRNMEHVNSYKKLRLYVELLKATTVLDPDRVVPRRLLYDWQSDDTVELLWADWHLLSRYAIPVREVPMEFDLISELKNDAGYFNLTKGDILGFRLLFDQDQGSNFQLTYGDVITILGSVVNEEQV